MNSSQKVGFKILVGMCVAMCVAIKSEKSRNFLIKINEWERTEKNVIHNHSRGKLISQPNLIG